MTADRRAAAAVAILFLVKAACLALFVTPLWDVPDEIGHFSYATDLADGRGAPLPGRGVIAPGIVALWPGHAGAPVLNWTAIHPPGYAIFAAGALRVARAFTPDLERQIRLTRLVSGLFGAATIFLLYELLIAAGAERSGALAFAAAAGCIPMFTHMASGVSHDTLSAALGVACAIAWVRLDRRPSVAAAAALAISLAAAGTVKATIAPVAIVLVLLLPARLPGRLLPRLAASAAIGVVALSTTGFWWIRRLGGIPTPPAARVRHGARAFFAAFRDLPIADHTLKNFFGLIGWTAHGDLRWFQISGPFLAVDLGTAVGVGVLAAAWTWRRDFRAPTPPSRPAVVSWLLAGSVLVATFGWLVSRPAVSPAKLAAESFLFALPFLAIFRVAAKGEEGIVASAQLVSLGFTLVYFWNVARSYLLTGEMRGAHGRYYFVVIGFLALGFWLPAADLLRGRPGRNRILAAAVLLLFANEAAFYAFRVVPFYASPAEAVVHP